MCEHKSRTERPMCIVSPESGSLSVRLHCRLQGSMQGSGQLSGKGGSKTLVVPNLIPHYLDVLYETRSLRHLDKLVPRPMACHCVSQRQKIAVVHFSCMWLPEILYFQLTFS